MNEGIRLFLYLINGLLYLGCGGLWLLSPEDKTLNFSLTIFSLAFTSVLLYTGRDEIKKMEKNNVYRKWGYTTINLFLVVTILAFLNYLSFKNSVQFDLSDTQINSISSTSAMVIKGLKKELNIKVFADKENSKAIVSILDLYRQHKQNMNIDVFDPDTRPDMVKAHEVDKPNTVVMEYEKRKQFVTDHNELEYSNALKKLGRESDPVIYYTVGHMEVDFTSSTDQGGGLIARDLRRTLADLRPLDILATKEIPADANLLLLWGPKREFFKEEIKAIENYLGRGGRLILALDPTVIDDKIGQLRDYFKRHWEISVPNAIVIDRTNFVSGSNGSVPLIKNFDLRHLLTKGFEGQVFFPLVSPVEKFEIANERGIFFPLAFSSPFPASWSDYSPLELVSGTMIYNSNQDKKGPASVIGLWEENIKDLKVQRQAAKILAFGNSSFIENQYSKLGDNFYFFVRSINYLANQEEILTLNIPIKKNDPIMISDQNMKLVFYISVISLPIVLFALGFFFYRRKRG